MTSIYFIHTSLCKVLKSIFFQVLLPFLKFKERNRRFDENKISLDYPLDSFIRLRTNADCPLTFVTSESAAMT